MPDNQGFQRSGLAPQGRRTIIACFVSQALVMGLAFGSFGPLLAANQSHLETSRAATAFGMSLITVTLGLLSPIAGRVLEHCRIRDGMIVGVILSAAGYVLLAATSSYVVAMAAYVLVGVGVCLSALIGPLTLVTRWVDEGRGKVLSLVNLPIILFASPFLIAIALPAIGRSAVYLLLAGVTLAIVPILALLVKERPEANPLAPGAIASSVATVAAPQIALVSSPGFWLLSIGIGIMAGTGVVYVVHLVPYGVGKGMTLAVASGMLSFYAGAGLIGTPVFGWIIDRIGAPAALVIAALGLATLSLAVIFVDGPALFAVVALAGACCTPITTMHGAALGDLFGRNAVARAMGYSYFIKLPFLVGAAPVIGAVYDATGSYRVPFALCAGAMLLAAGCFAALWLISRTDGRRSIAASV
jgi:MFS family permease